jgi:hypothetical protein
MVNNQESLKGKNILFKIAFKGKKTYVRCMLDGLILYGQATTTLA